MGPLLTVSFARLLKVAQLKPTAAMMSHQPSDVTRKQSPHATDSIQRARQCIITTDSLQDFLLLDDIPGCFVDVNRNNIFVMVGYLSFWLHRTTCDAEPANDQ